MIPGMFIECVLKLRVGNRNQQRTDKFDFWGLSEKHSGSLINTCARGREVESLGAGERAVDW